VDNIDIKNFKKNQDKDQDQDLYSMKYVKDLETDRELTQLKNQVLKFNRINLNMKIVVCVIIIFAFGGVLYCSWILIKQLIFITILGNPYSVFVLGSFCSVSVVSLYYIFGSVFKAVFADHSDNKGHLKITKDLMNKFR
jgi:hypothetical protein